MATTEQNKAYNQNRRKRGFIRGPWISGEAREALRYLCFHTDRQPCDVVSELIVEAWRKMTVPEDPGEIASVMREHGLSRDEARDFLRLKHGQ